MEKRLFVKLQCEVCKEVNYYTHKSRQKNGEKKLAMQKFCKSCRKHTPHKEGKK